MGADPLAPEINRFKYRVRFAKVGDLRLVSHHDLMHCCERLFRRADIPIAFTQGFHPSPRMAFALSLALGLEGQDEVLEIELRRPLAPEDLLSRLRRHAPAGLLFASVAAVDWRVKAQPRRAIYRLAIPAERVEQTRQRIAALFAQGEVWIERTRPEPREINIRPFLEGMRVVPPLAAEGETPDPVLEMVFWVTPSGTARPEEALRLLDLDGLMDEGRALVRAGLELADEVGIDAPPVPDIRPGSLSRKLKTPGAVPPSVREVHPTSLVQGPLSFDS